jgi:hypothetical protein
MERRASATVGNHGPDRSFTPDSSCWTAGAFRLESPSIVAVTALHAYCRRMETRETPDEKPVTKRSPIQSDSISGVRFVCHGFLGRTGCPDLNSIGSRWMRVSGNRRQEALDFHLNESAHCGIKIAFTAPKNAAAITSRPGNFEGDGTGRCASPVCPASPRIHVDGELILRSPANVRATVCRHKLMRVFTMKPGPASGVLPSVPLSPISHLPRAECSIP